MNIENISEGSQYAITINGNDSIQCFGKEGRMCLSYRKYMKIFNRMRYWCEFDLKPEYSFNQYSDKMGSGPRLHWHGHIKMKDVDRFIELGYTELKDLCTFKIDLLNDKDTWGQYTSKSEKLLKQMCTTRKLPYNVLSSKLVVASQKPPKDILEWFPKN